MALLKLNLRPSGHDLRVFAACLTVLLLVLAALAWRRDAMLTAQGLGVAAGIVLMVGLLVPPALTWVFKATVLLTYPLGLVLSFVIMALVYFVVMTPIGLIMRVLGRDPLERRPEPALTTYWKPRDEPPEASRYLRQF